MTSLTVQDGTRRPPGDVVATLPLTLRLTDGACDRLDDVAVPSSRLGSTATRLSRQATRLAGHVERQPPSRRGERQVTHRAPEAVATATGPSIGGQA